MDAEERNLWTDFGHYTALAAASFLEHPQLDFRIRREQTEERTQLAKDLCAAILQRLTARHIEAEAETWYDAAAGCYTFAIKQVRPTSDARARNAATTPSNRTPEPKKPWWKLW